MTVARQWSSAIAPERPPVPENWHWASGVVLAGIILFLAAARYADNAIPEAAEAADAVVVSLGAAPQRLEAPPENVAMTDDAPEVPSERADDAPPPAPPPQPRTIASFTQGSGGSARSGTGGRAAPPPPPAPGAAPPPAPPPPAPARVTEVTAEFIEISRQQYMAQIIYPTAALRREQSGTGVLRVTIARNGEVVGWQLVRSTGHGRLDEEIERVAGLVRQLDPLPRNYAFDTAEADIPIMFVLEYVDGA